VPFSGYDRAPGDRGGLRFFASEVANA